MALENVYRKMHNLSLSNTLNINIDTDLYFTDQKGRYFKIESIQIQNNIGKQICIEVDINGNVISDNKFEITREVSTIYDIDQLLGGA